MKVDDDLKADQFKLSNFAAKLKGLADHRRYDMSFDRVTATELMATTLEKIDELVFELSTWYRNQEED